MEVGIKRGYPVASIIFFAIGAAMVYIGISQIDEYILYKYLLFAGIVFLGFGMLSFQVYWNRTMIGLGIRKGFPVAPIIFFVLGAAMVYISIPQLPTLIFMLLLFTGVLFLGFGILSLQVYWNRKILLNILESNNKQDSATAIDSKAEDKKTV